MQDKAKKLYDRGKELMIAVDYEAAADSLAESIAVLPHFKTLELLGECYMYLGHVQQAIVPLAAATTLNRGVRAPSLLARAFLELGDRKQARTMARLALERDPSNRIAREVCSSTEDLVAEWDR
jgi:tetratricopeptide (TPR) repeat protein